MKIDANFDGGNIEVVAVDRPDDIQLRIRRDEHADYRQWFYFRATGVESAPCRFNLLNAGQVSYPEAWPGGTIVASYDREHWFRVATEFDDTSLRFSITSERGIVYFALFAPYSYERHQDLVGWALQRPHCLLHDAGRTIEGRQVELLQIGTPTADKKNIWVIARQHPAETMAEWFMEGLLKRLLDPCDATVRTLLTAATFYLVPNMNPDGGVAGNLRTNGAGTDLNRAWLTPSADTSPEVRFALNWMTETGVDLFLDIHGDEEIPYVFAAGCEGNPGYSERLAALDRDFRHELHCTNPDFSCDNGYPADPPGEADLSIACNQVGQRFDCLSLTIEMPFKDNKYLPDEVCGWSPQRSSMLGASMVTPILRLIDRLR